MTWRTRSYFASGQKEYLRQKCAEQAGMATVLIDIIVQGTFQSMLERAAASRHPTTSHHDPQASDTSFGDDVMQSLSNAVTYVTSGYSSPARTCNLISSYSYQVKLI